MQMRWEMHGLFLKETTFSQIDFLYNKCHVKGSLIFVSKNGTNENLAHGDGN